MPDTKRDIAELRGLLDFHSSDCATHNEPAERDALERCPVHQKAES